MCILCNMKYEDLCALINTSVSGLVITNCEKIEEITLPRLDHLYVKNCANLHTIHCTVDGSIILEELPKFTTLDAMGVKTEYMVFDPYIEQVTAYYCPEFLMPAKCLFTDLTYEEGCSMALKKYGHANTEAIMIERTFDGFTVTDHAYGGTCTKKNL